MSVSLSEVPRNVELDSLFSLPAKRLDLYIEQVTAEECQQRGIPYLKVVNSTAKLAIIFKPRCKLWSCPQCAVINQALWTWRAVAGARELQSSSPVQFVTLTSHEKLDAAGSIAVLPHAWGKLQNRVRRAAVRWDYLIVPEGHKNGRVHLHALTTAGLPKRWWKDNARECGMGYQSDLQEVKSDGGVAAYISKYLAKSLEFSNFAKGFHRVRTSQNWPKLPDPPVDERWQFSMLDGDQSLQSIIGELHMRGFTVIRADQKTAWKYINAASVAVHPSGLGRVD